VPQYEQPGVSKELFHETNNQLEIVVGAAEFLSRRSSDTYVQPASETVKKPTLSAAVTAPDQGCIPQASPANILF
jgi:hypothetical protein